ncbi:hypothetical protein CRUP_029964 [Coryphaenoides rupestris]|nr:hypothetical protein CRUP_029964 [Coryphaenoides rupestris]
MKLYKKSEVDCLMLWKLTREGEVGMEMAWVILTRMECCSCQRSYLRQRKRQKATRRATSEMQ